MGVLQNAFNQMLGTAAIAARLSPGYEKRQEMHSLKQKEKGLAMQEKQLPSVDPTEYAEGKTVAAQTLKQLEGEKAKIAERKFELKPTKKGAAQMLKQKSAAGQGPLFTLPADEDEIRQELADIEAAKKQEAKANQLQKYREFVSFFTEGGKYR